MKMTPESRSNTGGNAGRDGFFSSVVAPSRTGLGARLFARYVSRKLELIEETAGLPGTCLEIGPGEGAFARLCERRGIRYQAIERSEVLQGKLQAEGLDVALGTVPPIPHDADRFDMVCLMAVLEHMATFEQGLALLKECRRVLKPHGLLVLEVPDYLRGGIDFHAWDYTHSFIMTEVRANQILLDTGFKPVRVVRFTGCLSSRVLGWPIDLLGFVVHSRLVYWLGGSLGLQGSLFKFHKTFEPSIFLLSRVDG